VPEGRTFANVAEMKKAVGTEVGVSGWLEISQQVRRSSLRLEPSSVLSDMVMIVQRVNAFADATCDWQWIHTDPERAKKQSPFGLLPSAKLCCRV